MLEIKRQNPVKSTHTAARRFPALLYLLLAVLQPPPALVLDSAAPASRAAAMSAARKRCAGLMAVHKRNAKKEKAMHRPTRLPSHPFGAAEGPAGLFLALPAGCGSSCGATPVP